MWVRILWIELRRHETKKRSKQKLISSLTNPNPNPNPNPDPNPNQAIGKLLGPALGAPLLGALLNALRPPEGHVAALQLNGPCATFLLFGGASLLCSP